MDAWKNLSATGYTVTDELYTNFGTTKRILNNWPAYKGASLAIYTDATPHAGDALIQDVDYVLEDIDSAKTTEYSENIYTKLRMINNSTGDIYISYVGLGSYVDMDVFQNMLSPYRPTALNISAGNQVTDLSVYERGGASEKWNGWRIQVSVTGGLAAGTYNMLWTGTTYTIGGIALGTDDKRLVGESYIILELNKITGDWIIIEDGRELIHAEYSNGAVAGSNAIINFQTKLYDKYGAVTTGASWKFTNPGKGRHYVITATTVPANTNSNAYISINGTLYTYGEAQAASQYKCCPYIVYLSAGQYIDIREDSGHSANASTKICIIEQR